MQNGIGKKFESAVHILGQEFGADVREVGAGAGIKGAADVVEVGGELLCRARLRSLAQQASGGRGEPCFSGGVSRCSGLDDREHVEQWYAALLHQQHGQSVLEHDFLVRRKVKRLRRGGRTHQQQKRRECEEAQTVSLVRHCLAFPSFSGRSVATVRLSAPKYFFATR